MTNTNKILVEQAWELQLKLKRRLESCCNPWKTTETGFALPIEGKEMLASVHRRAYGRYIRRLRKLWS